MTPTLNMRPRGSSVHGRRLWSTWRATEALLAAHDAAYVDTVFRKSPEHGMVALDGDTSMNPFSLQAAATSMAYSWKITGSL